MVVKVNIEFVCEQHVFWKIWSHYVYVTKALLIHFMCLYNLCYFLPTEHLSLECEVFIHYYSQIVNSVSANVLSLSQYFVSEEIILPTNLQEISSIHSPTKAAGLLLNNISSALMSGSNEGFYKFLEVAERYGSDASKLVMSAIREKLIELKPKVKGTYGKHS